MAKTNTSGISFTDVMTAIKNRQFANTYLLMGDESYYIDRITDALATTVLTEEEQGFNQMVIYCTRETDVKNIITTAKRYPMMSEYQVVIVKEAQNLLKFDELADYIQNPLSSTILVISYKNGSVDRRKKIVAAVQKSGVVFESKKLSDAALPGFITNYLDAKSVKIDNTARMMLAENIGADLNRMASELDKLIIAMPKDSKEVTPELIERNIGISKEFNNWELRNAICQKNVFKANQILNYFESNPKANPPFATLAVLFNLFANMMQAYYSPDKSENGVAQHLGLSTWQVRELMQAMRNYGAMKVMLVIGKLRETDTKLKGVKKGNSTDGDIMRELIHFILH